MRAAASAIDAATARAVAPLATTALAAGGGTGVSRFAFALLRFAGFAGATETASFSTFFVTLVATASDFAFAVVAVFAAATLGADFLVRVGLAAANALVDFFEAATVFVLLVAVGFFALALFCALLAADAAAGLRLGALVLALEALEVFVEARRGAATPRPAVFVFADEAAVFDDVVTRDLVFVVALLAAEVVFF